VRKLRLKEGNSLRITERQEVSDWEAMTKALVLHHWARLPLTRPPGRDWVCEILIKGREEEHLGTENYLSKNSEVGK
jgi:hypothetical protein